jgi:hypothetical protein
MSEYVAWLNRAAREEGKYLAIGGHRANDYGPGDKCTICGRNTRYSNRTANGVMHAPDRKSHSTRRISVVTNYLQRHHTEYAGQIPYIHETFDPYHGWKQYPFKKRVSRSWLRRLASEGITRVALAVGPFNYIVIDWDIRELLRSA